jgi:Zn-dependent peptidase ImmA (M78 family)/transcriptional regulator with XRE-family HTH domain
MAEKTISQIINGVAPISYETAGKLELVLGIPARFWNARERSYREALVKLDETERLERDIEWLHEIPLPELIERGYVQDDSDRRSLVRQTLSFFGVSSVNAWRNAYMRPQVQFRGAAVQEKHPGFVAAWIRMGEIAGQDVKCEPFNPQGFREALKEIRKLSRQPAPIWIREIKRICAAVGVAVVFIKEVASASVSGAAMWLTKDKALIQVSLKYKSDDQLWFSFFHEAAHILLHSKKGVFIDYGKSDSEEDREADVFARNILIPPERSNELFALKTRNAICAFADSLDISPGIVVGRMQHDHIILRTHCNDLKKKFDWATSTP